MKTRTHAAWFAIPGRYAVPEAYPAGLLRLFKLRGVWTVAAAASLVLTAEGEQTGSREATPVVTSPERRFVVSGVRSPDNARLALWAEQVAERLERVMEAPVPFFPGTPITIAAQLDRERPRGRVAKSQVWSDFGVRQKLILVNPMLVGEEAVLEALCWLLANRYIIERQDYDARKAALGTSPDWLANGLAHSLFRRLRQRNNEIVLKRLGGGWVPSIGEVLGWEHMPPGPSTDKAVCGMVLAWLESLPEAGRFFDALYERLARSGHIDAQWLYAALPPTDSGADIDARWREWVAGRTRMDGRSWGTVSTEHFERLAAALRIDATEVRVPSGTKLPAGLSLADLIPARDQPWAQVVTSRLRYRLQRVALGRDIDFQELVGRYIALLDALEERQASGPGFWPWSRAEAEEELRQRLAAIERARVELAREVGERTRYLDRLEQRVDAGVSGGVRAYLDQVEGALHRHGQGGTPSASTRGE